MRGVPRAASAWLSERCEAEPGCACVLRWTGRGRFRDHIVIGRLVRSADFERVLRTRTRASSAHFALHHVADCPSKPVSPVKSSKAAASAVNRDVSSKLSTTDAPNVGLPVDDLLAAPPKTAPLGAPDRVWFGAVVPKRHARRSVTRTLLKRQIRHAVAVHENVLASGLWVVRLRAPFDRTRFPSAASDAMKQSAREELEQLLASASQRLVGR